MFYTPKEHGKDIKNLLDMTYKHLTLDNQFVKKVKTFRLSWVQKSPDYADFLGGPLLGVQPIRFSTRDDELFMSDTLGVDIAEVKDNISRVPGINMSWAISSNPVYLTITYLAHRVITDRSTSSKFKVELISELYHVFAYKAIGSLISHYYKFCTTPGVAKATHEQLSNRYLIKRYGTWNGVFRRRALDITPTKGLHCRRLAKYNTDAGIRVVNDLQGRVREAVKGIYSVMVDVIDSGSKIGTSSMIVAGEGTGSSADIVDRPDKYINYMNSIILTPNDFVDDDLMYLITGIIPNIDTGVLRNTLLRMSDTFDGTTKSKELDYVTIIILNTITYNRTKGIHKDYQSNIMDVLKNMKGYWTSSSVKNPEVKEVKKYLYNIVKESSRRKTKWLLTTTVVGILLYIFLRSIVRK